MEKYVYKIENNINHKIYIGQTNNLERRIKEHRHDKRMNHPIYNAIHKYGWDNFSVETLYFGEDYNTKEKEYIKLYRSNEKEFGYNIQNGGQDSSGENNPQSKLTQQQVDLLMKDLKETNVEFDKLAEKYNVSIKTIRNVNTGIAWRKNDITYPIREPLICPSINHEKIKLIKKMLRDGFYSIDYIARMFKVERYVILNINKGVTYYDENDEYPIRELGLTHDELEEIIKLLEDPSIPMKYIAKLYGRAVTQIYRINNGGSWHNPNIKYHIRKSTVQRNELNQ